MRMSVVEMKPVSIVLSGSYRRENLKHYSHLFGCAWGLA